MLPPHRHACVLAVALVSASLIACQSTAETSRADGGGGAGGALSTLPVCTPDGQPEPAHADIAGAVYSVPVPAHLEPYADYPLEDVSLCRTGAVLELGYSLPALLLGKKTRVSFGGTVDPASDHYELSGDDGTASCDRVDRSWSCTETFVGLTVDLEEVAKEASDLDPVEAAARLDVATIFGGDPIGILDFDLP